VQSVVEYMPTVHAFLTCRAVCVKWQGAADDAMGFLNGECWTTMDLNWARLTRHPLAAHFRRVDACRDLTETEDDDERRRIMHNIRHPDEYELVVKHCAILCLRDRLTSLRWTSGDNWASPGLLRSWASTVQPRASISVCHVCCNCACDGKVVGCLSKEKVRTHTPV
jgi:hypothetical protein